MLEPLYQAHGELCANHPWEVILATLSIGVCISSFYSDFYLQTFSKDYNEEKEESPTLAMIAVKLFTIVYSYYRFRELSRVASKRFLLVAFLFSLVSCGIFSSTVISLHRDLWDLQDAIFFFILLSDLSRTLLLAQYAFSQNMSRVKINIAQGISSVGPTVTLDTLVEVLLISIGIFSGIRKLEIFCYYACLSVVVHFIIFMTVYPACLSLVAELSEPSNVVEILKLNIVTGDEDNLMPNPILMRVKILMSAGLAVVHLCSYWDLPDEKVGGSVSDFTQLKTTGLSFTVMQFILCTLLFSIALKFSVFEASSVQGQRAKLETSNESKLSVPPRIAYQAETDSEILNLVYSGQLSLHRLEEVLPDLNRIVKIRREYISKNTATDLSGLPFQTYDYNLVLNVCCENVVGYVPLPVGVVGPLVLDGKLITVPMATTEGCLVASTNRGCKALSMNGVTSRLVGDGMSRGPVVRMSSLSEAYTVMNWVKEDANYKKMKEIFDSTSSYASLGKITTRLAGRYLFLRFVASTGDAMGMNMVSKGTEACLGYMNSQFSDLEILSLSGNFCCDKKPAAINWIEGRGKSVLCEAVVPGAVVENILKTTVHDLIDLNVTKNLIGSAMAGSIGGNNAHAANIVTAIYLACGQDVAQNVVSSMCMTLMEPHGKSGKDLYMTCTMPSVEVGTIGGGTHLPAQAACLDLLGVKGAGSIPGENAQKLAKIVCGSVLAGELSLMAALSSGHLVRSHLNLNRSSSSS